MARVVTIPTEIRYAHFGLYTTSAGGTEPIIVRRKMGEPTDYMHRNARKVSRQRVNLGLASQHWSHLTPTQKAYYRGQMAYVDVVGSPSEEKLLKGRQLFISREIRELNIAQKQLVTPFEHCIILCDEAFNPLTGKMWLYWKPSEEGEWEELEGDELIQGNFLFRNIKPGQFVYHPYGESEGYYDAEEPQTFMTQDELRKYHYHVLYDKYYKLVILEPWGVSKAPPGLERIILEPWSPLPPPAMEKVIEEPWTGIPMPELEEVLTEPWTGGLLPPEFEEVITEPWTGVLEQKFESYTTPSGGAEAIYANQWRCQTFLVHAPHTITSVKLLMNKNSKTPPSQPGTVVVSIRDTDAQGRPTGGDLCTGYINGNNFVVYPNTAWYTITFDVGYALTIGKLYAIVVRAPWGNGTNYVLWYQGTGTPGYPDGKGGDSANGGVSWSMHTLDMCFEEWGTPT